MSSTRVNFPKLILEICEEEKIDCIPISDKWAFQLRKNGRVRYIVGYQFPENKASSRELCQDKCLTYEVLNMANIPACPHYFLPNPEIGNKTVFEDSFRSGLEWLEKGKAAVIKDNYGTGGKAVYKVTSDEEMKTTLEKLFQTTYGASVSPYYEIKEEYRVVILDGQPMLTIRKERESVLNEKGEKVYCNWKHNLGQGATGIEVTDEELLRKLHPMAKEVSELLNIRFASVDIIETDNSFLVLEVNAGVMMEHFSGQDENCYKKAKEIYRYAIKKTMEEES